MRHIDDFDVSIFLTELSARHSLLTKQKSFKEKPGLESNSKKLTGWLTAGTREDPSTVPAEAGAPIVIREDDDAGIVIRAEDDEVSLNNIPEIPEASEEDQAGERSIGDGDVVGRSKRRRQQSDMTVVESSDSDEGFQEDERPPIKRAKKGKEKNRDTDADDANETGETDDKKKLGLKTSYDGFSIYGRILCLVVKRKGGTQAKSGSGGIPGSSQQMMENWVSTQAAAEQGDDGDEDG
ncbi:uncharacterized protein BDZ99DRAFT_458725 [Mytilinidion resinicola]|uniref:Uncharacterized protein n=1 Tax=Mytilinidion resinicola TaxID=574789 RepID=A0A6A6Z1Q8_9PEZI|nr:uncharacterized protein BDZ99DRAFT_458725 [Mytilinidion resinicola]KAF2814738.1 hypothetical protein BDZ99DRAFT_458725 [Mytilinidion resinicola]